MLLSYLNQVGFVAKPHQSLTILSGNGFIFEIWKAQTNGVILSIEASRRQIRKFWRAWTINAFCYIWRTRCEYNHISILRQRYNNCLDNKLVHIAPLTFIHIKGMRVLLTVKGGVLHHDSQWRISLEGEGNDQHQSIWFLHLSRIMKGLVDISVPPYSTCPLHITPGRF